MAKVDYTIETWSAFWLKLRMLDLTVYRRLSFEIRADEPIPGSIKVELHRACTTENDTTDCEQYGVTDFSGITGTWQRKSIPLSDFKPTPGRDPLATWAGMQELVFTFESDKSGQHSVVYLDNIKVER